MTGVVQILATYSCTKQLYKSPIKKNSFEIDKWNKKNMWTVCHAAKRKIMHYKEWVDGPCGSPTPLQSTMKGTWAEWLTALSMPMPHRYLWQMEWICWMQQESSKINGDAYGALWWNKAAFGCLAQIFFHTVIQSPWWFQLYRKQP